MIDELHTRVANHRRLILGIVIALAIAGLLAVALPVVVVWWLESPERFDAEEWESSPDDRLVMAQDVCDRHLLDGLSPSEVEALLGHPGPASSGEPGEVLWYAGMDIIDPNYIYVRFEDGRVVEYYIVQL